MDTTLVIGNYNYSSWSLRAWLAATVAGLEFEVLRIPLDTPEFRSRIAEFSPSGQVPVLRHGPNTVWDSLAICEYLAEILPEAGLWPGATDERARARAVSAEMHAGFASLRRTMPMNCRASGRVVTVDHALQADIARIDQIWGDALASSGGPFLFGHFTISDAMYAPVVLRFETYGVTQSGPLRAYREKVLGMGAMQTWIARARDEQEIIEADEAGR